jgi:hypothetical protein
LQQWLKKSDSMIKRPGISGIAGSGIRRHNLAWGCGSERRNDFYCIFLFYLMVFRPQPKLLYLSACKWKVTEALPPKLLHRLKHKSGGSDVKAQFSRHPNDQQTIVRTIDGKGTQSPSS